MYTYSRATVGSCRLYQLSHFVCCIFTIVLHYISSFSCTRSVRLFVGYVTKWHTCLPNITILFISFANGVRLGCVTGDRSSSFSIFLLANFPWKCTYSTSRGGYFYTFFASFCTYLTFIADCLHLLHIFTHYWTLATVGSHILLVLCCFYVI